MGQRFRGGQEGKLDIKRKRKETENQNRNRTAQINLVPGGLGGLGSAHPPRTAASALRCQQDQRVPRKCWTGGWRLHGPRVRPGPPAQAVPAIPGAKAGGWRPEGIQQE